MNSHLDELRLNKALPGSWVPTSSPIKRGGEWGIPEGPSNSQIRIPVFPNANTVYLFSILHLLLTFIRTFLQATSCFWMTYSLHFSQRLKAGRKDAGGGRLTGNRRVKNVLEGALDWESEPVRFGWGLCHLLTVWLRREESIYWGLLCMRGFHTHY